MYRIRSAGSSNSHPNNENVKMKWCVNTTIAPSVLVVVQLLDSESRMNPTIANAMITRIAHRIFISVDVHTVFMSCLCNGVCGDVCNGVCGDVYYHIVLD
jgi:hypothetical protein